MVPPKIRAGDIVISTASQPNYWILDEWVPAGTKMQVITTWSMQGLADCKPLNSDVLYPIRFRMEHLELDEFMTAVWRERNP